MYINGEISFQNMTEKVFRLYLLFNQSPPKAYLISINFHCKYKHKNAFFLLFIREDTCWLVAYSVMVGFDFCILLAGIISSVR